MLKVLDLGYKESKESIISNKRDFTSLAKEFISYINYTKLIVV